ncbi:MAG: MrpF/PhaF family protein [Alphaproteobacteria bacterium]|nr:MrpF/PhaF family protein [Alphaproteobacteria bacterium]
MDELLTAAIVFLLGNIAVGMAMLLRGERPVDRLLAAQLSGTIGVAVCLLLAEVEDMPAARDVALVMSVLAALTAVAFIRRYRPRANPARPRERES